MFLNLVMSKWSINPSHRGYLLRYVLSRKAPTKSGRLPVTVFRRFQLDLQTMSIEDSVSSMQGVPVVEELSLNENLKSKYMNLSEVLVRWITTHIADPVQRETFIRSLKGPQEVIGAFSAYLIYDYDLQYEAMELSSLGEQIQFLHRLLESGKLTHL